MTFRFVRQPEMVREFGRKRTTLWLDVREGRLTPPVAIGPRAVAWPSHEVEALKAARLRGLGDLEVKALVERLVQERDEFVVASAIKA